MNIKMKKWSVRNRKGNREYEEKKRTVRREGQKRLSDCSTKKRKRMWKVDFDKDFQKKFIQLMKREENENSENIRT